MKLNFKEFLYTIEQYSAPITAAPDNAMHPGVSNNPPTPVMTHRFKSIGVFPTTKPNANKVFNMKTKGANVCFNLGGQAGACIPQKVWEKSPFQNGDTVSVDYFAHPRDAQRGKPTRDIASVSVIKRQQGG